MDSFPDRLRQARTEQGLSYRELAKRSGCTEHSVWLYENCNRAPSLFAAEWLSEALGVSLDWLVGRDVPKELNLNYGVISK